MWKLAVNACGVLSPWRHKAFRADAVQDNGKFLKKRSGLSADSKAFPDSVRSISSCKGSGSYGFECLMAYQCEREFLWECASAPYASLVFAGLL